MPSRPCRARGTLRTRSREGCPSTLRGVAPDQIAQNLAFVNWTVLAALAVGTLAATVVLCLRTSATAGFVGFTSLCAAAFAGLALVSDGSLPPTTLAGSPVTVDAAWDLPRRAALAILFVGAAAYSAAAFRGRRAPAVGGIAVVAGAATLAAAALGWGDGLIGAAPLVVQLLVLAAATGGVFAGMVLGHWYLVTPKLSTEPALLLTRALTWVVIIQLALFLAWVGLGAGRNLAPFSPLVGSWALFVWLRLLIGLVFPVIITWAAHLTVRTRSMESATGLLYIDVGAIAAGTILAAGLYFGAGMLV